MPRVRRMCRSSALWHTRPVLSSCRLVLVLGAMCLVCGAMPCVSRAQLVESPLDSAEAEEEGIPFRGSTFSFLQSLSGNSFFKDTQLSYNPEYSWGFALNLIWHFDRTFQLALNQELEVELTDSDTTTLQREPLLSDTALTFDARLFREKLGPEFDWTMHTSVTVGAPTSLASQAASLVLATQLAAAAAFSFPKVLRGLGVTVTAAYGHRFLSSNVVQAEEEYPCNAGPQSRQLCSTLGGSTNRRNSISAGLNFALALTDQWGMTLGYTHAWRRGADLADYTYVSDTGSRERLADGSARHWRNRNTIDIGLVYDVLPWLGLGLSASNLFEERGPDSELRAPFRPADTAIGLDVLVRLDEVYLATSSPGPGDDE